MHNATRFSLLFLLIAFACGCAERALVALIPDPEGGTGSITVSNKAGEVVIDTPYQATAIREAGKPPAAPEKLGKAALDKTFAEALSIEPQRPLHFLLYFSEGSTLQEESVKLLPKVLAAIKERHSVYISVIGHTDTLGSVEYNMELSEKRAAEVKEQLVMLGVPAETIETTSHGKENPQIPTGDNILEPRNRRVEIVVR